MIVLTSAEARVVRGRSPRNPSVSIEPVPLRDGRWVVPETVLDELLNTDVSDWLRQRPQERVPQRLFYTGALRSDVIAKMARLRGAVEGRA